MLKESVNNQLEYVKLSPEEMKERGILGRLIGICADFQHPTRNGRKYGQELWEKVFNSDLMKERIENGVCFGELGHPADREETDMEKVAVCLAEIPQKGKDGKLRAVFDILSTPNGKILKSLCDYGSTLGISSRGSGDLFTDYNGQESVDPDTYNCEGFDIVLLPAVREARLQYVTESLNKTRYRKTLRDKLTESINKEDENNQRIMRESLHDIGIDLDESSYTSDELFDKFGTTDLDIINAGNEEDVTLSESLEISDELNNSINGVMASYQNANKWLDSVKEFIYSDLSCPFFSSFVHELAHTMPGRFDKFGDILHTMNIEIPYPTTLELDNELTSVDDAFAIIFGCLDDIKNNLNNFIELTDKDYHGMACSAEELLNDIESEYSMLFRLRDKWNQCNGDLVDFDKFVAQYVEHKEDLLESLSYDEVKKNAIEAAKRDGYDQIITVDKDGNYGITRDYPNNNFEDFGETQVAKVKTSYKDGVQHIDIEESLNENFRADNKESLINVDFDDISIGDLIYVTNGMYDVCVGDVLKKHIDTDSKGRFLYGCDVNIIVPLDSHLKVGMQTIEWKYSKDAFELFTGDLESLKKKYISTLEESVDEDILVYDSEAAKTDLFDVASPQEMADTFNKPVKDGDEIYYPVEESLSDNISYKNTDIIENEDGTFTVTINDETQVFNSLKNAKTWIDMMQPHLKEELYVSAGKMNDELLGRAVKEFSDNAGDYGDALTFVKNKFSQYSLNDQKDIARYINQQLSENLKLKEEQVGRDTVEIDKSVDDVLNPDVETKEEDNKSTTIVLEGFLNEELSSIEEQAAEMALKEINLIEVPSREQVAREVKTACDEFEECDFTTVFSYVMNKLNEPTNEDLTVGDTEVDVDSLQEALHRAIELEKKVAILQEQLSASYARENKLNEDVDKYKHQIERLAQNTKEIEALTMKLEKANSHISEIESGIDTKSRKLQESIDNKNKVNSKLTESVRQRDSKIKSLQEQLDKVTEQDKIREDEMIKLQESYDSLSENYSDAQQNIAQLKSKYSKEIKQSSQLVEKYQRIAEMAVNKYIDTQAVRLGVTSTEIKNKLPKGYGFKDIDNICENLQEYKLNMSSLPFNTNVLNEEIGLKARNVRNELIPQNDDDEITDFDLKFANQAMR